MMSRVARATLVLALALATVVHPSTSTTVRFHEPTTGEPPSEYFADVYGSPPPTFVQQVVVPESKGYLVTVPTRFPSGAPYVQNMKIVEELEAAWKRLSEKPPTDVIVLLEYNNWPPGRESISGEGLDVPASLVVMLADLKAHGYLVSFPSWWPDRDEWTKDLDEIAELESEAARYYRHGDLKDALEALNRVHEIAEELAPELAKEIALHASNVGWWLARDLKGETGVLVPVRDFERWFESLPEPDRMYVEYGLPGFLYAYAVFLRKNVKDPEEAAKTFARAASTLVDSVAAFLRSLGAPESLIEGLQRLEKDCVRYLEGSLGDVELKEEAMALVHEGWRWEREYIKEHIPRSKALELFGVIPEHLGPFGWGPPPGKYMIVYGGRYFFIPCLKLGHVWIAPQPLRGFLSSVTFTHSLYIPPTYEYLAYYWYMSRHVDVIVHVGTHGTLAWLPFKKTLPSHMDFPVVLAGTVPIVYIWCPTSGELPNVEWRLQALVIDHLPPAPDTAAGFYVEVLINLLHGCFHVFGAVGKVPERLKRVILDLLKVTKVYKWLNPKMTWQDVVRISENPEKFAAFVAELHNLIHAMQASGEGYTYARGVLTTHVFGALSEREASAWISSALFEEYLKELGKEDLLSVSYLLRHGEEALVELQRAWEEWKRIATDLKALEEKDPRLAREAERWERLLVESALMEYEDFIEALRGEAVPPGPPGDPLEDESVLPTGRMLYVINPVDIPSKLAWILSSQLVEELPSRSCFFVVTSTDVVNDRGVSLATLLRLLGVEPVGSTLVVRGRVGYAPVLMNAALYSLIGEAPAFKAMIVAKAAAVLQGSERYEARQALDRFLQAVSEKVKSGPAERLISELRSVGIDKRLLDEGLEALRSYVERSGVSVGTLEVPEIVYGAWLAKFLLDVRKGMDPKTAAFAALGVYVPQSFNVGTLAVVQKIGGAKVAELWRRLSASALAKLSFLWTPWGFVESEDDLILDLLAVATIVKPITDRTYGPLSEDVVEFLGGLVAVEGYVYGGNPVMAPPVYAIDELSGKPGVVRFQRVLGAYIHLSELNPERLEHISSVGDVERLLNVAERLMALAVAFKPFVEDVARGAAVNPDLADLVSVVAQLNYELVTNVLCDKEVVERIERIQPFVLQSLSVKVYGLLSDESFSKALLSVTYGAVAVSAVQGTSESWASKALEFAKKLAFQTFVEVLKVTKTHCGCYAEVANPALAQVLMSVSGFVGAFVPNPMSVGLNPNLRAVGSPTSTSMTSGIRGSPSGPVVNANGGVARGTATGRVTNGVTGNTIGRSGTTSGTAASSTLGSSGTGSLSSALKALARALARAMGALSTTAGQQKRTVTPAHRPGLPGAPGGRSGRVTSISLQGRAINGKVASGSSVPSARGGSKSVAGGRLMKKTGSAAAGAAIPRYLRYLAVIALLIVTIGALRFARRTVRGPTRPPTSGW